MSVIPYVFGAAVIAFAIWQRLKLRSTIAANQDKSFGVIAERLGMRVEKGDPKLNLLYFQQPMGNYLRELVASGQPYGHAARFWIVDGFKTSERIIYKKLTTTFGGALEVAASPAGLAPDAAFEVVLRNPNSYLGVERQLKERTDLREVKTGHALFDTQFIVRASDPSIGPRLVPALDVLAPLNYVHLAYEDGRVWTTITRMGLPMLTYSPEELLLALETAACALEGKAAPARPSRAAAAGAGAS